MQPGWVPSSFFQPNDGSFLKPHCFLKIFLLLLRCSSAHYTTHLKNQDTMASVTASKSHEIASPLLRLPREIRDQIYLMVLCSPTGYVTLLPYDEAARTHFRVHHFLPWKTPEYNLSLESSINLALLQTCRQLYWECKDIFWKENRVWVSTVRSWQDVSDIVDRQRGMEKGGIAVGGGPFLMEALEAANVIVKNPTMYH
jgi:hypothetical protein